MRFYSGCMVSSRFPFIEAATKFVFDKLGLDIPSIEGAPCCIEPVGGRSVDLGLWDRGTRLIREMSGEDTIVTVCDGCSLSLTMNGIDTMNLIEVVTDNIDIVRENIVSPIEMNLAIFPGCHCESVCKKKGIDAVEALSDIVAIMGSEPVRPEKNLCCGGGASGVDDALAKRILDESIGSFRSSGADAVVVSCPFCFMQFDVIARYRTYHISELLAHAMGWTIDTEKYHRGR